MERSCGVEAIDMAKYDPLHARLKDPGPGLTPSFEEIEALVGGLR